MTLIQLKYFQTICELQSMTKASEFLNITQPSLTRAVRELEKEFGVILFKRHKYGMAITKEGEELKKVADQLLAHAQEAQRFMADLGKKKKTLNLGIPPMIGSIILPTIYRDYVKNHNDIELIITEEGTNKIIKLLNDDQLDMVIIPHNDNIENKFNSLEITQFEIVCCAHKNNSICKKKTVSPKDLQNKNLVLFKNSFFQTEQIKKWFALDNVEPKVLLQTDQLSTLIKIIENDQSIGFVFKKLILDKSNLVAIQLKNEMNIKISLVWKKNKQLKPMKTFANYVKNLTL